MKLQFNVQRFRKAIADYKVATKKDEAEIINRTGRNIAFRAAQFTPATSAAKIESELRTDNLLAKLATRNLKRKQGRYTREEHRREMIRIRGRRRSSAKALRAGWSNAIFDMGGKFRGGRPRPGSSASKGFGRKATTRRLVAHLRNSVITTDAFGKVSGAAEIPTLVTALDKAIEFVTADMELYALRKLAKRAKQIR